MRSSSHTSNRLGGCRSSSRHRTRHAAARLARAEQGQVVPADIPLRRDGAGPIDVDGIADRQLDEVTALHARRRRVVEDHEVGGDVVAVTPRAPDEPDRVPVKVRARDPRNMPDGDRKPFEAGERRRREDFFGRAVLVAVGVSLHSRPGDARLNDEPRHSRTFKR